MVEAHFQPTWKEEKSCSPGTRKIFVPRARIELTTLRIPHVYRTFQPLNQRVASSILALGMEFPLSRASMVSPAPSKLKMFPGSLCVLLTSVSLKLIKIKIKLINAPWVHEKKKTKWRVKVKWYRLILFSFYNLICFFFWWSELIRVQFYFTFIFLFDPCWSESIRVDPTWTGGLSWSGPTLVPASLGWKVECFNCSTIKWPKRSAQN